MYKAQAACAIAILFIGILYFRSTGKKSSSSKRFVALLICSFVQLIFDILSVYTVNHLESVSPVVNRLIHVVYMGLLQSMFYIAYRYLETIIEEEIGKTIRRYRYTLTPLLITLMGTVLLPLHYVESKRSNYSYGPAAFMTYIGVAVYLFLIIRLMVQYGKLIPSKKKRAIYITLFSEIPVAVYQILIPDSLVTCIGILLLNLGIYMTTENPDTLLAEQLEKEKRRADSANATKTNFLANMSHEIRTPITAVLGMNELILRETKDSTIKHYAKDIEGAAKSLLSIINDILDITKIEAGKLSVISVEYDFSGVIKDVVNMISFKAKVKSLEFEVLIDQNIPRKMVGDDIRLRQILVNLLSNAVKYTHEGKIAFSITEIESADKEIEKLHFSVKDTGIGIKEEDLQKLCKPFERIEEKKNRNIEGTGLGMSITKQLLELLNSNLQISSVYGVGSEFSFDLEQKIVDATPVGNILEEQIEIDAETYQHTYEAPKAKILLVDDNELNRKVFIGLLKSIKLQVDEAGNGKTCLEKVKQNRYDIIFMDYMMPEMDGIETFHKLNEMEEFRVMNTPVVILTANALVGVKEKFLKEGFASFLTKPIDYEKLENVIRDLLDESLIQEASSYRMENPVTVELPVVEGLDWKYALTHFKDQQMMLETVRFFADSLTYEAQELETLFTDIDSDASGKAFCTKVHSMKNSAATIGIIPLAGMAKVLEDYARNNETDVLKALTPTFLQYWYSYREKLSDFMSSVSDKEQKNADDYPEEIVSLLHKINQAAEEMDIDGLDQLWTELSGYDFPKNKQENLNRIQKAIMEFDVDYLQKINDL